MFRFHDDVCVSRRSTSFDHLVKQRCSSDAHSTHVQSDRHATEAFDPGRFRIGQCRVSSSPRIRTNPPSMFSRRDCEEYVLCCKFSPVGDVFAVGLGNGTVKVSNVRLRDAEKATRQTFFSLLISCEREERRERQKSCRRSRVIKHHNNRRLKDNCSIMNGSDVDSTKKTNERLFV